MEHPTKVRSVGTLLEPGDKYHYYGTTALPRIEIPQKLSR